MLSILPVRKIKEINVFLMVNQWESTGLHTDITYCLDPDLRM